MQVFQVLVVLGDHNVLPLPWSGPVKYFKSLCEMLHLLNPLLHTKWHSLQNLLRSRIRLETSHILRNFGSCSWCKPHENCHLLFFTQFIPVKVSESVRFLKQLIYNALSIPITAYHCPVSAMAEIFERSSFWSKSSRPALIRTTWLFLVHPPPKLGASEFLAAKMSFGILDVLGRLAAMHLRLFISGIACNTVKIGTLKLPNKKKTGQKDVLLHSNFGTGKWYSAIGSLGFLG